MGPRSEPGQGSGEGMLAPSPPDQTALANVTGFRDPAPCRQNSLLPEDPRGQFSLMEDVALCQVARGHSNIAPA